MAKRDDGRRKFTPGGRVWFEINGRDYQGTIVDDDGGILVMVDVDGVGHVKAFNEFLMLENQPHD